MDSEKIKQKKREIIGQFGEWTNHNIQLVDDIYTIDNRITGCEVKLKRFLQIVADITDRPLEHLRVLDLACLEGLYGLELALHGAKVVAIEGREANIEKARFAKDVLGLDNLELVQDDVRNLSREKYGCFDVVLCIGIFYHLDVPDIFEFTENIVDVCQRMALIDTHVSMDAERCYSYKEENYWGKKVAEHDPDSTAQEKSKLLWSSLDNVNSFYFTRSSFYNLLSSVGFSSVYECHNPPLLKYEKMRASKKADRNTFVAIKGKKLNILASTVANEMAQPIWPEKQDLETENARVKKTPLVITGMHRSGTSLTASFIKALGVNVGNNLVTADNYNVKGYFEDVDFLEFQRSVLQDCCRRGEPGFPDWGWTESECLNRRQFEKYIKDAQKLIDIRHQKSTVWGWKDPRTTLMLDFWDRLLPDAKYLFVYRLPWEVANSMLRLNTTVFAERPDYRLKIWAYYNRHILKFYHKHSERCILFNVNSWIKEPNKLVELLENKFDLKVRDSWDEEKFKNLYEQTIFNTLSFQDHAVKFLYYSEPDYFSLLGELDRTADIPSDLYQASVNWDSDSSGKYILGSLSSSCSDSETAGAFFESSSTDKSERAAIEKLTELENKMSRKNEHKKEIAISIVIPCYNQGEYILEAISSVESCQDDVYEIVIVNDCSTDNLTKKVLSYLKEYGYCVIDHQENQGLARARNTGIEKARGRYILPLDCDNKIRAKYITKGIEILDKYPEVGVVYGDVQVFGDKSDIWQLPDFDINKIASENYIDACAVLRKEVWSDCGGYDDKIPDKLGYEDWDLWLGAAEKGWKFYHINEVLFDYRLRSGSMLNICRIPENHERLVRYICTKHLDIYRTNFANIFAGKDSTLLKEKSYREEMESQVQKTEAAFEESQQQLQRIQSAWEEAQLEVERIRSAWDSSQEQLRLTHSEWEEAQSEVERIRNAWEKSQEQLRLTHSEWEEAQSEVERIRIAWEQSQDRIRLTNDELEQSQQQTQSELQRIQSAWEEAQEQAQRIQSAWEEASSEAQQIQTAWEEAQEQVQLTQAEWERSQQQVQQIQTAWETSQQQVHLTQAEWERSQSEVHRIQTAWEQAAQQLQLTQVEWERSQSELQLTNAEWQKVQQQTQHIQTAWETSQQQAHHIQGAWEQTQSEVQHIQGAWETSQQQAQHIQGAWEQTQSEVQHIQGAWETSQQQAQHIQGAWEQTQSEVQHIHSVWEQTQQQTQHIQGAWEQAQQQVHLIQTAWETSQQQAQQSQTQLHQMQAEWERTQTQLHQMQAEWERTQTQLHQMQVEWEQTQNQLQIAQAEHQQTQAIINQMESSKFWKLRKAWVRFKQAIGFSNNIEKQ